MRMPSSSISMIQRHASERLSCRLSNQNQYNNQQQNNYQQNYQKPQSYQQTKQQNNYQPINKNHQNQLAAAAAAAAAVSFTLLLYLPQQINNFQSIHIKIINHIDKYVFLLLRIGLKFLSIRGTLIPNYDLD